MISMPAVSTCGIIVKKASAICNPILRAVSESAGIFSVIPSRRAVSSDTPALIISGIYETRSTIAFEMMPLIEETSFVRPPIIISTLGRIFPAAVAALSTSSFIRLSKSCSSSAIPTRTFFQAAPKDAREPLIVSLASLAVVPVIPISVWITWIASTTSA